jgi:hypothetical protein
MGLDQTMSVYTPGTDGDFTVLERSGEKCRLVTRMDKGTEDASAVREAQTGRHPLLWGPTYTMPPVAQIEVNGVRWNYVENSAEPGRGLTGSTVYQRCDVVKVIPSG